MIYEQAKVCVVTVTYGDRKQYLEQVLSACLKEKQIVQIIVVDNASTCDKKFFDSFGTDRIEWIRLEENTGSANGYHIGIKKAYESSQCDFIWLLDDDNVPEVNALNILLEHKNEIRLNKFNALKSFRKNFNGRPKYRIKNTFQNFHFLRNLFSTTKDYLPYTQYGGLFFSREAISTIGLPNRDYFLYADDADFTHRFVINGGHIFLIKDSIIHDVDNSWHINSNKKIPFKSLVDGNDMRVYYSVRNHVYFEKKYYYSNFIIYNFNKLIYLILLLLSSIYLKKIKRFKLIMRAIKDADKNKLGKTYENIN